MNTFEDIEQKLRDSKMTMDIQSFHDVMYNDVKPPNDLIKYCKEIRDKCNDIASSTYYIKDELNDTSDSAEYKILIVNNDELSNLFKDFILTYKIELSLVKTGNYYCGLDFEFTNTDIAMIQCNFETSLLNPSKKHINYIWVFNPNHDTDITQYFIDNIMTNEKCIKILQGSDSLDVPYIYSDLFKSDPAIFKKFIIDTVDVRFLCEYYKISMDMDRKCTIYSALRDFDVISEKQINKLQAIDARIGPKNEQPWDIYNMLQRHIEYVIFDVIYLKYMVFSIHNLMKKNKPNEIKSLLVLPNLVNFVYNVKKTPDIFTARIKTPVDTLNTHRITNTKNVSIALQQIFEQFLEKHLNIVDDVNIKTLVLINYPRKQTLVILKYVVYAVYVKYHRSHITIRNGKPYRDKLEIAHLFDILFEYPHLLKFVQMLYEYVIKIIYNNVNLY